MSKQITPTKADLEYVQRCIKSPTSPKEHTIKNLTEMLRIVATEKNSEFGPSSAPDYLVKYFDELDKHYPNAIQRSRISSVCHDLAFNNPLNYPDAPAKKDTTNSWLILILLIGGCMWVDASRTKPAPIATPQPAIAPPTLAPVQSFAPLPNPTPNYNPESITACPTGCTNPPPDCLIKGNISQDTGAKIYHRPGQRYYAATIISPAYGERWFCTEDEALANGWRPAAQ